VTEFPFKEKKTQNNISIREFSSSVDSGELIWHKDKEDRIVEVLQNNNWMFQMDNELPKLLKEKLFVPKETYHRVIKGDGNLVVKVTKLDT
jgi:hypothetical protein